MTVLFRSCRTLVSAVDKFHCFATWCKRMSMYTEIIDFVSEMRWFVQRLEVSSKCSASLLKRFFKSNVRKTECTSFILSTLSAPSCFHTFSVVNTILRTSSFGYRRPPLSFKRRRRSLHSFFQALSPMPFGNRNILIKWTLYVPPIRKCKSERCLWTGWALILEVYGHIRSCLHRRH